MTRQKQSFLYGAAMSAHQVEGDNVHNDWWDWEKRTPGVERSGKAVDHYNRYREDFALAKQLGHNAHRLSIEWSRIEPAREQWNESAVQHYRDVLEELHRLDIKTFVTLHHFTNPLWFARSGGWTHAQAPEIFERYVRYVAQHLGDLVDFWITVNEPMVYATKSYWYKDWPPAKRSLGGMLRVIKHMARAHVAAYHTLHSVKPGALVGVAKHLIAYLPEHHRQLDDRFVVGFMDWWFNHRWYRLTGGTHDFIGVNFYFTTEKIVSVFPPSVRDAPWEGPVSDMNWPIRPEGLTHVLLHMRRYEKPIYITENGLADADDSHRADFIRSHLRAVEKAQDQGADVRGYLYWSLLDNFEWADEFTPRFGLVEVDYKTMKRTPRKSAYVYKAIIEQSQH